MVVNSPLVERDDLLLRALADATRRDILSRVLTKDASISDLARRYPMSFAAVQKHVAVLTRAGLVTKHAHGREQRVRGNPDTLAHARRLLDQIEEFWRARLERFEAALDDHHEGVHDASDQR